MGNNNRQVGGKTVQVINVWKAHPAFRDIVLDGLTVSSPNLPVGGARVANDQVWFKPPGSGALNYHRDSSYFDFSPADVTTA